jgi:phosphoenolpyruvate carboxykinase (ATP)
MPEPVIAALHAREREIFHDATPALLYEHALAYDGAELTANGALAVRSGARTGRSPSDKRVVATPEARERVWWGKVNRPIEPDAFRALRRRAIDYLASRPRLYVVDGWAGWDPSLRLRVRVVCSRPYHALFMRNMLIRPAPAERALFDEPDCVVWNAGEFPADDQVSELTSRIGVCLDLDAGELVILGTEYAGEMKKGVFTLMNYRMPLAGVLPMHCSVNEGVAGDVTVFFGLSGTGKTTLSADPRRRLVGDDEHCWSDEGIFNIEGGCYAKCIDLSPEHEPEIHAAIRFGALLENTVQCRTTRAIDFADGSITQNTRVSYPLEFIPNAKLPATAGHPSHVVLLTCDAFGVRAPRRVPGCPDALLDPSRAWSDRAAHERAAKRLAAEFEANYARQAQ